MYQSKLILCMFFQRKETRFKWKSNKRRGSSTWLCYTKRIKTRNRARDRTSCQKNVKNGYEDWRYIKSNRINQRRDIEIKIIWLKTRKNYSCEFFKFFFFALSSCICDITLTDTASMAKATMTDIAP